MCSGFVSRKQADETYYTSLQVFAKRKLDGRLGVAQPTKLARILRVSVKPWHQTGQKVAPNGAKGGTKRGKRCHQTGQKVAPNESKGGIKRIKRCIVRIIKIKTLKDFWTKKSDSESALKAWYKEVSCAEWQSANDIQCLYRTASILKNNRVCFTVCGNKYRLIVKINYAYSVVYIRFIGTHAEYDTINAEEIQWT